jgi:hypothetical protein
LPNPLPTLRTYVAICVSVPWLPTLCFQFCSVSDFVVASCLMSST